MEEWKTSLELIKNVVVILAILAGGIWALFQYRSSLITEQKATTHVVPSLELEQCSIPSGTSNLIKVRCGVKSEKYNILCDFTKTRVTVIQLRQDEEAGDQLVTEFIKKVPLTQFYAGKSNEISSVSHPTRWVFPSFERVYELIISVPSPGLYYVSFEMADDGILDSKFGGVNLKANASNKPIEYSGATFAISQHITIYPNSKDAPNKRTHSIADSAGSE